MTYNCRTYMDVVLFKYNNNNEHQEKQRDSNNNNNYNNYNNNSMVLDILVPMPSTMNTNKILRPWQGHRAPTNCWSQKNTTLKNWSQLRML